MNVFKNEVCRVRIQTHSVLTTYELTKEGFLIMLLRLLPATSASKQHLNKRTRKRNKISSEVCGVEAMTNREWTKAKSELRHSRHGTWIPPQNVKWTPLPIPGQNSVYYVRTLVVDTVY